MQLRDRYTEAMFVAAAKVILDFYGNQNIKEKRHQMELLLKSLRKKFNVSATEVSDFEDLERCVIGLGLTAGSEKSARHGIKEILEFLDAHSFARVVMEDTEFFVLD